MSSLEDWALEEKPMPLEYLEKVRASYLETIERLRRKPDELEELRNFFSDKERQTQMQLDFLRRSIGLRPDIPQLIHYKELLILLWRGLKEACV